jgi:lactoylglutathione lyase
MNQFTYTIFYVKDVTASINFYERAFGFKRKFIAENNEYGELITGATTLSFASVNLASSNLSNGFRKSSADEPPFAVEIGISTTDVGGTIQSAIRAGGTLYEASKTKPWGQTVAYVRDPDGFLIEICTPMG